MEKSAEIQQISFGDNITFQLPVEHVSKSPMLISENGHSSRSSENFKNLILPVLAGYSTDCIPRLNTKDDFRRFIDEIKYYQINLPQRDIYLASSRCGFLECILAVRGWFRKHAEPTKDKRDIAFKRFHGKKKDQYIRFMYFVQKMFKKMYGSDIKDFNVAQQFESIFHDDSDKLALTNWNHNNALYNTCDIFRTTIIEKNVYSGFYIDFDFTLNINADNTLSSITSQISRLFE